MKVVGQRQTESEHWEPAMVAMVEKSGDGENENAGESPAGGGSIQQSIGRQVDGSLIPKGGLRGKVKEEKF